MKQFAVIGHPIGHSISPVIHLAAYGGMGLAHQYATRDCPNPEAVSEVRAELAAGRLSGVNITVPWKRLALELADHVDDSARRTGAANVWVRTEAGEIVAHNTDAPALAERIRAGLGTVAGEAGELAALVLGSGGAARAAVVACQVVGARPLYVSSRKWHGDAGEWPGAAEFRELGATPVAWGESAHAEMDTARAAPRCRVLLQATSAGMRGVGAGDAVARVIPWAKLDPRTFVYDVVYIPAETEFLRAARAAGLACEGGLSMLIGQAAAAIRLWLGREPDLELMNAAARRALFGAQP